MFRRAMIRTLAFGAGAIGLPLGEWCGSARANERWLISPEERQASLNASSSGGATIAKTATTDPAVDIVSPKEGEKIVSPVDFDVRFRTSPPAVIDPSSIRVLYGYLLIDITKRIVDFGGTITANGITLPKAPLQPDTYRVTVEVANSLKHRTRSTVSFRVD